MFIDLLLALTAFKNPLNTVNRPIAFAAIYIPDDQNSDKGTGGLLIWTVFGRYYEEVAAVYRYETGDDCR